jgi:hypothetical protein
MMPTYGCTPWIPVEPPLVHGTVADVSLKEKVGYDAVIGALGRQVPTTVNWDEIDNLGTIGIDEISLQKGHKSYRAVVTARQDNGQVIILAVLPDRKKDGERFSGNDSSSIAGHHPHLLYRYVGWLSGRDCPLPDGSSGDKGPNRD